MVPLSGGNSQAAAGEQLIARAVRTSCHLAVMGASLGYSAIIYIAPVTTENYIFAITTFPQLTFPLEISKSELLRSKLSLAVSTL
jgi:hypothetical protein